MKTIFAAIALISGLASTALADAPEIISAVEVAGLSPITDWSGAYAGILGSSSTGSITETDIDDLGYRAVYVDINGPMYGEFAGFNIQRGVFVYGVEGAYSAGSVKFPYDTGLSWNWEFTSFIDLKARTGFAVGNTLVYGFTGVSLSELRRDPDSDDFAFPTGLNYGAGIDFLVTDRVFLGAEYIVRELSGDMEYSPFTVDTTERSFQVRAGMNF